MRKITEKAAKAFHNGYEFKSSNTRVVEVDRGVELYLHDNLIAHRSNGNVYVSLAGWCTPTTRERLNGLEGVRVYQKDFVQYLNGVEINAYDFYKVS